MGLTQVGAIDALVSMELRGTALAPSLSNSGFTGASAKGPRGLFREWIS